MAGRRPSAWNRPSSPASTEPTLLRPGGIARADIERVLGRPLVIAPELKQNESPLAPGLLASHYAPRTRVRPDAIDVKRGEALLAFGPQLPPGAEHAVKILNLSPQGDLVEAAAQLFDHLRALDASAASCIAVMPIPDDGLGEAINDRLGRAAAPKGATS